MLWVGYGFMISSLPIILPNTVTFFLSAPLLMMKLRYREGINGAKTGLGQNKCKLVYLGGARRIVRITCQQPELQQLSSFIPVITV